MFRTCVNRIVSTHRVSKPVRSLRNLSAAFTGTPDKSVLCGAGGEIYGPEHYALQDSLSKLIETELNPHVAQWEDQKQFPVHEVIKKFGQGGFLGASFPVEAGGMGLDYSYTVAIAETMGEIACGAIPMAVGIQMDMASPGTSSDQKNSEASHFSLMQIRNKLPSLKSCEFIKGLAKNGSEYVRELFLRPSIDWLALVYLNPVLVLMLLRKEFNEIFEFIFQVNLVV